MQVVRKHKRNRVVALLLFPLTIPVFIIGWSLLWIGTQKATRKVVAEQPKEDVSFEVVTLEETAVAE